MRYIKALLRLMIGGAALVFILLSIFTDGPKWFLTVGLGLNLIFLLSGISKRKKSPEIMTE
ncbi:MAG: hypothetical protein MJ124_06210 [Lachnospiraceae bacterium]|nr:hypothetical protein [Lachnospiraceae bacterium]